MESSVVLIESDLLLMRTLTRGLQKSGYHVTQWASVDAALAASAQAPVRSTIAVIIDLNSTAPWSVKQFAAIEACYKNNRVILLDDWLLDVGMLPKRWSFLRKPFGITELLDELEALEALPFSEDPEDASSDELTTR